MTSDFSNASSSTRLAEMRIAETLSLALAFAAPRVTVLSLREDGCKQKRSHGCHRECLGRRRRSWTRHWSWRRGGGRGFAAVVGDAGVARAHHGEIGLEYGTIGAGRLRCAPSLCVITECIMYSTIC